MPLSIPFSIIFPYVLAMLVSFPVSAQHKSWRQYTMDDGLPGKEVWDIIEDHKGYIWFSTNRGICRFNGYEFEQPVDTSTFSGSEAFSPYADDKGRIWFGRLDKTVWFVENDTIRYWKHNDILEVYRDSFSVIHQINMDPEGNIWFGLDNIGLLMVGPDGSHVCIRGSANNNFLVTEVVNGFAYGMQPATNAYDGVERSQDVVDILFLDHGQVINVDQYQKGSPNVATYGSVWPLRNGDLLLAYNGQLVQVSDRKVKARYASNITGPKIAESKLGEMWIATIREPNPGLYYYPSIGHLQKDEAEICLEGYHVSDVHIDREGGIWATTLEGGVFYCNNPSVTLFDKTSGLSSSGVMRLTNDNEKFIYAGLESGEAIRIDAQKGKMQSVSPLGLVDLWTSLLYDTIQDRLWSSSYVKYLEKGHWRQLSWTNPATRLIGPVNAKKIAVNPTGTTLWMSSTYGFYSMDIEKGNVSLLKESNSGTTSSRTFAVVEDRKGTIWVATIDGLRVWNGQQYELPPFTHSALDAQSRDLELLTDGSLAIGTWGKGLLVYNPDKTLTHFTSEDGLCSNFISKLVAGPNGNVFACTDAGLTSITRDQQGAYTLQVMSTKQGLPSNLVNDVTWLNGETWVASNKGLVRFADAPTPFPIPKPVFQSIKVNNRTADYMANPVLNHTQNNIAIRFFALHFRSQGDILYRYRLQGADTTFLYTKDREIHFASLAPGNYAFEVQAQNTDRQWSGAAVWAFRINPPWWRTWWFMASLLLVMAAVVRVIMRERIASFKEKSEISGKIKDLEMAALRAQINPHFIFNCLGSIQQFIAGNNTEAATKYIARFARLVRLALHSSVDGKHSLKEEIEMLDNYLALEQMRFKGKYVYSIHTSGNSDPDEIHLPPMLVQPFVENAVLHGVKGKTDGGEIRIEFSKEENMLRVTISDNGPGISPDSKADIGGHKSIGTTLTRNRLDLLSGSVNGHTHTHENITDPQGRILGSRVILQIPLE